MRLPRRRVLTAVAGAAALAGCLGGGGGEGSPTSTATETTTAGPGGGTSPTVRVSSHPDLGEILVGPEGLTLYMFDRDTKGTGASSCHDSCAQTWPPLTVTGAPSKSDGVTAGLNTFAREGGARQVTAGGWPLYYYAPDESPGDAKGQGVGGVWWALAPDGAPVGRETTSGGGGGSGGY